MKLFTIFNTDERALDDVRPRPRPDRCPLEAPDEPSGVGRARRAGWRAGPPRSRQAGRLLRRATSGAGVFHAQKSAARRDNGAGRPARETVAALDDWMVVRARPPNGGRRPNCRPRVVRCCSTRHFSFRERGRGRFRGFVARSTLAVAPRLWPLADADRGRPTPSCRTDWDGEARCHRCRQSSSRHASRRCSTWSTSSQKGVVADGDVTLGVAGIDLIYLRLSALLCAADRVLPPDPSRAQAPSQDIDNRASVSAEFKKRKRPVAPARKRASAQPRRKTAAAAPVTAAECARSGTTRAAPCHADGGCRRKTANASHQARCGPDAVESGS